MRIVIATGCLALAIVGCSPSPPLPPDPRDRPVELPRRIPADRTRLAAELKRQHARWHAEEPFRYQLKVTRLCFCDPGAPWVSRVEDRSVISSSGGHFHDGRNVANPLRTVEALFLRAESAVGSEAEEVEIDFDVRFGYPKRILIDEWRGSADDELELVAELEALP